MRQRMLRANFKLNLIKAVLLKICQEFHHFGIRFFETDWRKYLFFVGLCKLS